MLNPEYVQSIVTGDNLVVRNLQVTQGYYRLSQGMRRCIGGSNISWCTFATHASKTAGQALRHELMPRLLRSTAIRRAGFDDTFQFLNLGLNDPDRLPPHQRHNRLGEALRRLSALVSDGNITVFEELRRRFRLSSPRSAEIGRMTPASYKRSSTSTCVRARSKPAGKRIWRRRSPPIIRPAFAHSRARRRSSS